ncbi:MAG: hydantoinase B/oxoprolinase family protein [Planctomycetota bacterium]|nr:hydantoinase B/oxoprolinase family protein [Planctomycetota bacterium]
MPPSAKPILPPRADNASAPRWLVALDTGGTFTDLVGRAPDGTIRRVKVPSDGSLLATVTASDDTRVRLAPTGGLRLPRGLLAGWRLADDSAARVVGHDTDAIELSRAVRLSVGSTLRLVQDPRAIDAPRLGLHILTETPLGEPLPPMELRLSTTRGTNALLEGRGARVGVLVSDGLTGVVEIGDQTREDLFARVPQRTRRAAHAVAALPERSLADGSVERAADAAACVRAAESLARAGCDSVVVSLAHALANDREREIASLLRDRGVRAVAAREIAPHPRLLTRSETACIHAQIAPILEAFVEDATRPAQDATRSAHNATRPAQNATHSTHHARAFVFTSAGVLQRADRLLARDTLYSGPAGGARAVCAVASRHGIDRAVGFDMGGTSSDVSRVAHGEAALRSESRLNGMTVAAPSVAIDSVAAGGGSICRVRHEIFEVGPESAGANPGPACYGRGGPLAITDINLLAGRLAPGEGAIAVDRAAAEAALAAVAAERGVAPEAALQAFLEIADARMALAIEALCVRDAVDPRGHTLVAFGGAGGQHACAIAVRLGLDHIVFPRHAGFLCAAGVLDATPARFATVTVLAPLDAIGATIEAQRSAAIADATAALAADGFASPAASSVEVALRLTGQEASIRVPFGSADELRARFVERFRALFGYAPPARAIEVVSIEARVSAPQPARESQPPSAPATGAPTRHARILSDGEWLDARVLARSALAAGDAIDGPAIVTDAGETVVLDRGWRARVDASGDLVATRADAPRPRVHAAEQELFAARLESIALAMGHVLERTALSPNIRDRLDFSCAVLDSHGTLVQNAPHLPVHLGALGVCTRAVMRTLELADGDIAVTNHPAFGGSHLPDVTTVAPVFVGGACVAFVAVRAHHAEIGGTRPGSFPPDAATLAEEGVVLEPFHAVRAGAFDAAACRARFAGGPYPSRNPDENLADLEAQLAATRHGVAQVAGIARELGGAFAARCQGELDRAATALERAIARIGTAPRAATVHLDDGSAISARADIATVAGKPTLRISFAGSAGVHPRNFNAPLAVTRAATLYTLRLLIDEGVPMNEGLVGAFELDIPEGLLHPPFSADPARCPPVVAGNVETSQSVVAALVELFGLSAESQSTMNNTLFGNDRFTIYETLGGGAGAGHGAHGASAVHVHMSNTRLTDIDVLERRAGVVIRRFEVRKGSGGDGEWRGGDGLVRSYEFREPVSLSFFGSRRAHAPRGAAGGGDGARGVQQVEHGGRTTMLHDAVISLELAAGDRFTVETPGGGGWGPVSAAARARAD